MYYGTVRGWQIILPLHPLSQNHQEHQIVFPPRLHHNERSGVWGERVREGFRYVRQDDILMGTLTVEETFEFQAALRLHHLTEGEKQYRINQILKQLNLEECRNARVGGQFSKSISGGQRKRVAIGIELLANPQCIVLDEPTSGLDSHNAYKIIRILKDLSKEGKIVIATLHQPSSLMFKELDRLLLLSSGQTLYLGKASRVVEYMQNLGIKVNEKMNPADFFMLEVSEYKKSTGYQTKMTSHSWEGFERK